MQRADDVDRAIIAAENGDDISVGVRQRPQFLIIQMAVRGLAIGQVVDGGLIEGDVDRLLGRCTLTDVPGNLGLGRVAGMAIEPLVNAIGAIHRHSVR